ncbi:MAG: alanine racemase [Alphaproteobacteria bacterium]|nr:alanine racemase [Alphaproteobacteria bacterium]
MPDRNPHLAYATNNAHEIIPAQSAGATNLLQPKIQPKPLRQLSDGVTARAVIDLSAIVHNWQMLQSLSPTAHAAAVVKADAYGLGAIPIAEALAKAGCSLFFVARLAEAIALRQAFNALAFNSIGMRPDIAVLDGLLPQTLPHFIANGLIPVLNDPTQIQIWQAQAPTTRQGEAMIHVDSGMNRLGMGMSEASQILNQPSVQNTHWRGLLSHLACADQANHPQNQRQRQNFTDMLSLIPHVPASFVASEGIALGQDYHFDITRPGISLYGLTANRYGIFGEGGSVKLRPAVLVSAQILQSRMIEAGEYVGYGASYLTHRPSRIITLGLGYADGFPRSASIGATHPNNHSIRLQIDGNTVILAGRVSMDLMCLDVTDVSADLCEAGNWIEIISDTDQIHDLAEASSTSTYEILTRIGKRVAREYHG